MPKPLKQRLAVTRGRNRRRPDPNELKPSAAAGSDPSTAAAVPDPNELKPDAATTDTPAQAPAQVNEIQQGAATNPQAAGDASSQDLASDKDIASSKHKKKKGLSKIIPIPQTH